MKNNIKAIRERNNLTQKDCADIFGVTLRAWQTYEQGVSEPKYEMLCKIADYFNTSLDNLLGREKKPKKITPTDAELEAALLEAYRTFPEDVRRDFLDSIRNAVLAERGDIQCITKRFISNRVSAGFGAILDDSENWETVLVPLTNDSRDADFILRVCGDSMEPKYSDGDYVLVKQQDTIEQGEIGIFCVDGEGYIKQLGNNVLISLNKKYPEIPLNAESRCFGKVLGKTTISEV